MQPVFISFWLENPQLNTVALEHNAVMDLNYYMNVLSLVLQLVSFLS